MKKATTTKRKRTYLDEFNDLVNKNKANNFSLEEMQYLYASIKGGKMEAIDRALRYGFVKGYKVNHR